MPTIMLIIVELFSIALLSWYCVTESSADIESDLTHRTTAALAYAGIHDAKVVVDGQNVQLQGHVDSPDAVKLAEKTIASTWGVERVINRLRIAPANHKQGSSITDQPHEKEDRSVPPLSALTKSDTHENSTPAPSSNSVKSCSEALHQAMKKGKIRFERGSEDLTAESKGILDNIAAALASCPHAKLKITGHTDATGQEADNLLLSKKRAEAVSRYLQSRDLPREQLRTEGRGEAQPVADNSTAKGRERNRRIEFKLLNNTNSPGRTP